MSRYKGKAVVFSRPLRAEVHEDVLFPEMDEEGVVIKTAYSVISRGTELDLYTEQMHGRGKNAQWYPILPGYLPVGEVIEVGSKVTHVKVGDQAVASNLFGGFDERYCCAWAGHTEYVVCSRHSHTQLAGTRAVKVPEGVPPSHAPLAVLGAIALKGVEIKVKPQKDETVLVVGQGVIGNFAAQLCKEQGARVIVADLEEKRLAVSRECGIEETIQVSEQNPLSDAIKEKTNGEGPEVIIDVTGDPRVLESLLRMAKVYGRVHAQGMYLEELKIYIPETLFGRNLTLSATCGEHPEKCVKMLDRMDQGKVIYKPLLSAIVPVDEATEAYERVHGRPNEVLTVGLKWQP